MNENSCDAIRQVFRSMVLPSLSRITHPHFCSCVENAKQSWYRTHMAILRMHRHTDTRKLLSSAQYLQCHLLRTRVPHTKQSHAVVSVTSSAIPTQRLNVSYVRIRINDIPHQTKANSSEKVYQSWS